MKQHSYLPESLTRGLTEDEVYQARIGVIAFQATPGWYRFQQRVEALRDQQVQVLVSAAKRSHGDLVEAASAIRTLDMVYEFFEKIKEEGDK